MDIGPRRAVRRGLDPERIVGAGRHLVAETGGEGDAVRADLGIHGDEGRVRDPDADLLGRGDEEEAPVLALQHRGEQPDHRRPADRRALVEPGPVGPDLHVQLAAIGRVPQMHRRRAATPGAPGRGGDPFGVRRGTACLILARRHRLVASFLRDYARA